MTMVSFRLDDEDVEELDSVAEVLGRDRSDLLRDALRRQLRVIAAESDIAAYERRPFTEEELALCEMQAWAPDEDWSDWADAAR